MSGFLALAADVAVITFLADRITQALGRDR